MASAEAEPKPKPKQVEDDAEPLTYKTWVLKVSIHCEACKRKVKRILRNIEGVYETDIDLKQQKVVVKGNVESETLIKKLLKTRKHAELWPEKPDSKGKKKKKSNKKDKKSDSESADESSSQEDDKEKVKFELIVQDPAKNGEAAGAGKTSNGGSPTVKNDGGAKQSASSPASDGQKTGGGGKKKKKKKKSKGNTSGGNAGGDPSGDPPANGGAPPGAAPDHSDPGIQLLGRSPFANIDSPPRHFVTQYPTRFCIPPLNLVRYSTAYAASLQPQSASYYATPQGYSYAYMHPGARAEIDPPPSDYDSYPPPPSDSLEIFSDENPNGCTVM